MLVNQFQVIRPWYAHPRGERCRSLNRGISRKQEEVLPVPPRHARILLNVRAAAIETAEAETSMQTASSKWPPIAFNPIPLEDV
jgi:hypothetical protein